MSQNSGMWIPNGKVKVRCEEHCILHFGICVTGFGGAKSKISKEQDGARGRNTMDVLMSAEIHQHCSYCNYKWEENLLA